MRERLNKMVRAAATLAVLVIAFGALALLAGARAIAAAHGAQDELLFAALAAFCVAAGALGGESSTVASRATREEEALRIAPRRAARSSYAGAVSPN